MKLFGNNKVVVKEIPENILDVDGFVKAQKGLPPGGVLMVKVDELGNVISAEVVDLLGKENGELDKKI